MSEYYDPDSDLNQRTLNHLRENGQPMSVHEMMMLRDLAISKIRDSMKRQGYEMPDSDVGMLGLLQRTYRDNQSRILAESQRLQRRQDTLERMRKINAPQFLINMQAKTVYKTQHRLDRLKRKFAIEK